MGFHLPFIRLGHAEPAAQIQPLLRGDGLAEGVGDLVIPAVTGHLLPQLVDIGGGQALRQSPLRKQETQNQQQKR